MKKNRKKLSKKKSIKKKPIRKKVINKKPINTFWISGWELYNIYIAKGIGV